MSKIEWLWCGDADLDLNMLSVPERLSKHGYVLILNRMETGKTQAAELCIHDVLTQSVNPNIVIICPEFLLGSWYSSLLWDTGVEFKYFGVFEESLNMFSGAIANYCLVTSESLARNGENSVLGNAMDEGFVWDLMIIDMPHSGVVDIGVYTNGIKTKAKKLLINAPAADEFGEKCEKLADLTKTLLHDKKQADAVSAHPLGEKLTSDGAVLAGRNMTGDYKVKTINYEIDEKLISSVKRLDDVYSGIPLYNYCGNIFEEYALAERETYLKDAYSKKDLRTLTAADGKLAALFKLTDELMLDVGNRIAVYCVTENTLNYVSKAIKAKYDDKPVCVYDRNVTEKSFIKAELGDEGYNDPRILVTDDKSGSQFINISKITHIINYEYPENPAVLEQRYTRIGRTFGAPSFYIFSDKGCRFDGRMLRKRVLGNLDRAFHRHIPDKSLFFNIEDINGHIAALVKDIKYICDCTAGAGAASDVIERFRVEYDIPGATTAEKTNKMAKSILKKLAGLFELGPILEENEIDEQILLTLISIKVKALQGKRVYISENGALSPNNEPESPPPDISQNKIIMGVMQASGFLRELTGENGDYALIKTQTAGLSDSLKLSVLINLWKHYKYERKIPKQYKEFIELYNKGVN